jgi:flavin reductase (DIM6/NTAB) family NADH-FMN oxidoreductase RutF
MAQISKQFLLLLWCPSFLTACHSFEITSTPPLLNVPTYSLATLSPDGRETGMNILTFATPVSVNPDRVWAIGLYKKTQAHEHFSVRKQGVLQLLTERHSKLVRLLGGSSGHNVDKQSECRQLGFEWVSLQPKKDAPLVLPGCAHYLSLKLQGELIDAGSHDVAICRVDLMFVDDDEAKQGGHLMTATLRDKGIITKQGRVAEETDQ